MEGNGNRDWSPKNWGDSKILLDNLFCWIPSGLVKKGKVKEFSPGGEGKKHVIYWLLCKWISGARVAFRQVFIGPWYAPKPHQMRHLTKILKNVHAKFHQNYKPTLWRARWHQFGWDFAQRSSRAAPFYPQSITLKLNKISKKSCCIGWGSPGHPLGTLLGTLFEAFWEIIFLNFWLGWLWNVYLR